jgi:uncharacterized protein (DUF4415 family)
MKAGLIVLALFVAVTARAHPVAQGAIDVQIEPNVIELQVRPSLEEIMVANMHASAPAVALAEACRRHAAYLLAHLHVFADGKQIAGEIKTFSPPQPPNAPTANYTARFRTSRQPQSIRLEQDVLNEFYFAPGNRWETTYIVTARDSQHTLAQNALLTSKAPLVISSESRVSSWRTAVQFVAQGINHILTGYDHLLFIAALALAVTSFWELFKIIAAFTLAHTITLTLSVLDIVRLSSRIVEPMIAASIVFVAMQNVFWPGRGRGTGRLVVAFFFGLFHGLGFAGGLLNAMNGMPAVAVGIAIAGFSLGVELGHQIVVLPLFALTKLARAWHKPARGELQAGDWLLRGGSALISAAGMFYLVAALLQTQSLRPPQ